MRHAHPQGRHAHDLGFLTHKHKRNGKTYFSNELRSDGVPVKCEGHWSVELDITDDWCYPPDKKVDTCPDV